ncbi:MAG: hypothetical protein VX527_00910 [Planctomycetota bacterium]|nr:hypothetical protein [Planctomycetota bacterium]
MSEALSDMLTCVVLAPLDRPVDPQVYAALSERGWSPRVEHDPRMAMAEACLVRRELQLRAAWQSNSGLIPGLVLAPHPEPDDVDAMRTSMARHVPDIPIWTTHDHQLEPLNESARISSRIQETMAHIETPSAETPALVFHPGDEDLAPEPLSREEVAMLLHDQTDPPQPDDPEQP